MTEHEDTAGGSQREASLSALEILAASLALRLTLGELEWLYMELEKRADEKRREAGGVEPVLAGYRDAWDPSAEDLVQGSGEQE